MEDATDISTGGGFVDERIYDNNSSRYNISDGTLSSYVNMYYAGAAIQIEKAFAEQGPGTPDQYRLNISVTFQGTNMRVRFSWGGNSIVTQWGQPGMGITRSIWFPAGWTWSQINGLVGTIEVQRSGDAAGQVTIHEAWIDIRHYEVVSAPATGVAKTGAAAKSGAAVKIGTATLIGNSVADTVIGGLVSADVQGYQADDSGDYGTEGSLIELPTNVFKHFLVTHCGLTVADNINSSSYSDSDTLYTSDNVSLSVVLLQRPDMRNFLSLMASQCKSYQFWQGGEHHLKRVPVSEVTDKTIEGGRIDIGSVKIRYTPRDEIINRYTVNFDKHWIGDFASEIESYRGVLVANSTPSQSVYGVLEGDPLNLDYVGNSTQALRLANWLLDETAYPRLVVEFSGGQYLADMEKGDIFEFDFTSGDELDRRLLGLVVANSDQFRIMDMWQSERGKIHIQAYIVVSSTSETASFFPSSIEDDGYTQGANFYNTTVANVIGSYSGDPYTSTTTTTSSSTSSTASTVSTSSTHTTTTTTTTTA